MFSKLVDLLKKTNNNRIYNSRYIFPLKIKKIFCKINEIGKNKKIHKKYYYYKIKNLSDIIDFLNIKRLNFQYNFLNIINLYFQLSDSYSVRLKLRNILSIMLDIAENN